VTVVPSAAHDALIADFGGRRWFVTMPPSNAATSSGTAEMLPHKPFPILRVREADGKQIDLSLQMLACA
jgi:hypothetical protein